MRKAAVGLVAALFMGGAIVLAQGGGAGRQGGAGRGGGGTTILEQAPTDRAIAIPKEKLNRYLKDMDAKKLQTLRMIEGGKQRQHPAHHQRGDRAGSPEHDRHLGSDRRQRHADDRWKARNGKILNGVTNQLKVGDVVFIPSGLPHGVSGVNGNITWLNIRWDDDYPAGAQLGAGRGPQPAAPAAGARPRRRGASRIRRDGSRGLHLEREARRVFARHEREELGRAADGRGRPLQRQHPAATDTLG